MTDIIAFLSALRDLHPDMACYGPNGGCFRVYLAIKRAFPDAEPWYDSDHVITKVGDYFYDIRGQVEPVSAVGAKYLRMDPLCFNRAYQWDSKAGAPESKRQRPRIEWSCEPHDCGWLVIAKVGDFALARHIGFAEWREAHEQTWLITSVIRTLSRNAARVFEPEMEHFKGFYMGGLLGAKQGAGEGAWVGGKLDAEQEVTNG